MGVDCRRQNATTAIFGVCWFLFWTGFSFGAHFFTRLTVGLSTGYLDSWLTITALTICQLLIGYTVLGALLLVLKRKNRSSPPVGVRNINLKLTHNIYSSAINKLEFLQTMSWNSAMFLYPVLFILFGAQGSLAIHISLVGTLISGVFHITYTVISTCVILKYTSTIGHATCNLLKRILVAIFFFLLGKTVISSSNWVMGMIMLIRLVIYFLPDALIPIKGW